MSLTPLFTSLTVVLVTRTLLPRFTRAPNVWSRLVVTLILQGIFAVIPIVSAANWWVIIITIVLIDLTHILMISLTKERLPLAHFVSFIVAAIVLVGVAASPTLVPAFNTRVSDIVGRALQRNAVLALLTPQVFHYLAVVACGLWIACVEANNPITLVIKRARLMPDSVARSATEPARGRMIGILERGIVFMLAMTGNLAALGLVLAAKGLARFKDLDKRPFAEYVLIGTLISVAAAVLVGVLLKPAIQSAP